MVSGIVKSVSVNSIQMTGLNPRKNFDAQYIRELAASIKRDGQWNPIIVRELEDGNYDLIAGECRLRAVKRAGWTKIRARVLRIDDEEARLLALKTNVMRRDLNPVEEAQGVKELADVGWSIEKVAKHLNKSSTWVFTRLKLIKNASEGLQNAVLTEQVCLTSAVKISELTEGLQGPVTSKAIKERLNVKEVTKLVELLKTAEHDSNIEFLLRTPMKDFFNPPPYGGTGKPHIKRNNGDMTPIQCDCGTRYFIDWGKHRVVSERVVSEKVNGE